MFVGHLAVALAAKRAAPAANLGWLIAGVTALDLIWPLFLLAGIEHARIVPGATAFTPLIFESYPWSHSLVMAGVWGLAFAALARLRGVMAPTWLLLVALVVSHWLLDVASHAPDMPLWPGPSPRFGTGLWQSVRLTLLIEGTLWLLAIVAYLYNAGPRSRMARMAFWSLVAITTIMWATSPWSPPPPTVRALGCFALIGWITIPWVALADRDYQTLAPEDRTPVHAGGLLQLAGAGASGGVLRWPALWPGRAGAVGRAVALLRCVDRGPRGGRRSLRHAAQRGEGIRRGGARLAIRPRPAAAPVRVEQAHPRPVGGALGGLLGGSGASQSGLGGLVSMLDMNRDGNPLDDILRMASGKR